MIFLIVIIVYYAVYKYYINIYVKNNVSSLYKKVDLQKKKKYFFKNES